MADYAVGVPALLDTDTHYAAVEYQINVTRIRPGDLWSLIVNGKQYNYVVPTDPPAGTPQNTVWRTTNLIAQGLVDKINADGATYAASLTSIGGS